MSDIQLYLLDADSDKAKAEATAAKTASALENKTTSILQVIESLGEYLNNEDAAVRAKSLLHMLNHMPIQAHTRQAMAYLADVLNTLPAKVLSRQQRDLLGDFILSRISNGAEGLGHCARGILALERLGRFDHERVASIVKTILDNTSPLVQFKQQTERLEVLRLFDIFMSSYRKQLQDLHNTDHNFLPRLIVYLDGEKDPRNLMIIFSFIQVPMVEWDVSRDSKDLFEAVFNYFPITFRPPPNDPYGITSQDLKDRLRDCLSATGHFAPFAFPSLLDKLDSTSANVKRDSLVALKACVERYGPATVNLYSITLWDAVKFEILNVQEDELAVEALEVLEEISRQLSLSPHEEPLQNYLKPISRECNEHLEDAPTKQSSASGRILGAASGASAEACSFLTRAALPHILQLYTAADNIPKRRGLLEVLHVVLLSNARVFGKWRADDARDSAAGSPQIVANIRAVSNTLADSSEQCLDLLISAVEATPIKEVSFRVLVLECLQALASVKGILDESDLARTCRTLNNIVIEEEPYGRDEVKALAIDSLVAIARQKPQVVAESSLPAFMAQLPDSDSETNKPVVPILEALAKLSAEPQIFGTIAVRLKNKLYGALRHQGSSKYIESILSALLYTFSQSDTEIKNPASFGKYYTDFVMPLLKEVVAAGQANFSSSVALDDESLYDLIGRICNIIIRDQPWQAQTEVCRNVYTVFRPVDPTSLPPFATSSKSDSLILLTSTHLIAALQTQATPHTDVAALLKALVRFGDSADLSTAVFSAVLTQISLLVSKYVPTTHTTEIVGPFLVDGPASLISAETGTTLKGLRMAFSMFKALVLRTDPTIGTLVPRFLALLSGPTHGEVAARLLGQTLAPDPMLTKDNHCKVFAIHKQRLFGLMAPQLVTMYRAAATAAPAAETRGKARGNQLTALAGLVQHVPYELLQTQLESLTPLIMQSLALDDPEVQAAAIATLTKVALEDAQILEQHVGSLVTRLLEVAGAGAGSKGEIVRRAPPRTRAAALGCLGQLVGRLRDERLVPFQRQVVKRLAGSLDDGRRAVRAEAVRCRSAWMGLAGPEEDDE